MGERNFFDSWEIVPNTGVGEFQILDKWDKIEKYMKSHNIDFYVEKNRTYLSLTTDNMKISFDKKQQIFAITVFNNFKGKIFNKIGLGSTLRDVKYSLGEYIDGMNDSYPTYELAKIKGVEFKLSDDPIFDDIADDTDWDETIIPISEITVWNDSTWREQIDLK